MLFGIFLGIVNARDFYSFESNYNKEISKQKIEEILSKLDSNQYKMLDETLGFHYRWVSRWFSPYNYDIYLTTLEKNQNINLIRIEGNGGDALSLRSIFFHEKTKSRRTNKLYFLFYI